MLAPAGIGNNNYRLLVFRFFFVSPLPRTRQRLRKQSLEYQPSDFHSANSHTHPNTSDDFLSDLVWYARIDNIYVLIHYRSMARDTHARLISCVIPNQAHATMWRQQIRSAHSLCSFLSADGELVNVQRCPRYLHSLPENGRRT